VSPEQVIRDRLLTKINRTNEQLISEQNAKQRMYFVLVSFVRECVKNSYVMWLTIEDQ